MHITIETIGRSVAAIIDRLEAGQGRAARADIEAVEHDLAGWDAAGPLRAELCALMDHADEGEIETALRGARALAGDLYRGEGATAFLPAAPARDRSAERVARLGAVQQLLLDDLRERGGRSTAGELLCVPVTTALIEDADGRVALDCLAATRQIVRDGEGNGATISLPA